jgi:hypothetical protein
MIPSVELSQAAALIGQAGEVAPNSLHGLVALTNASKRHIRHSRRRPDAVIPGVETTSSEV